jgi:hypothetical protein
MLVLSPFLCMGVISEYFKQEGNIPVCRHLLHICMLMVMILNGGLALITWL